MILVDTPWDGYCEQRGWVEACVTVDQARDLLAEFCPDDNGYLGARPAGPARRVHLRLTNLAAYEEYQWWVPCHPTVKTAVEFFEFAVGDE